MSTKEEKEDFDALIKRNLINAKKATQEDFGYVINGKTYSSYFKKEVFDPFVTEAMKVNGFSKLEVTEKDNEPPHAASVASSSRFCYLGLRNADIAVFPGYSNEKNGNVPFEFEKILSIKLKNLNKESYSKANLDAYYNGETTDFYFEFKCHELFDSHNISKLDQKYDNAILVKIDPNTGNLRTRIDCRHFDAKQFVTHLAGIDKNCLGKGRKIVLSYVYFYPDNMGQPLLDSFQKLETEISKVFNDQAIQKYCKANNITLNYYRFENDVMDGFENHPGKLKLILSV